VCVVCKPSQRLPEPVQVAHHVSVHCSVQQRWQAVSGHIHLSESALYSTSMAAPAAIQEAGRAVAFEQPSKAASVPSAEDILKVDDSDFADHVKHLSIPAVVTQVCYVSVSVLSANVYWTSQHSVVLTEPRTCAVLTIAAGVAQHLCSTYGSHGLDTSLA
jgi:hypothetical protein